MVPQKVLDTELKKSFAHFNEGRIPVSTLSAEKQSDFIYLFFFNSQHAFVRDTVIVRPL